MLSFDALWWDHHGTPLPHHPDRPQLPKIQQSREPEPSIIKEKRIADFTRVVEQTGILEREPLAEQSALAGRLVPP